MERNRKLFSMIEERKDKEILIIEDNAKAEPCSLDANILKMLQFE